MSKLNQAANELNIRDNWVLDQDYLDCVADLLDDDAVMQMEQYPHHGAFSCLEHSLAVSYRSYKLSLKLGLDARSAARGGLLHDLYLYDRYEADRVEHRFGHARMALENAGSRFELNEREQDIIEKHMWPLNPALPKYAESVIVTMMDKYSAAAEFIQMDRVMFTEALKSFAVRWNPFGRRTAVEGVSAVAAMKTGFNDYLISHVPIALPVAMPAEAMDD